MEEDLVTCDMYQAAGLMAVGCRLSKYTWDRGRVYFHIENIDGGAQNLVMEYLAHRLQVDALTLVDNARSLKTLCSEMRGSRGGRSA